MICPLKFNSNTLDNGGNCAYDQNQCEEIVCMAWDRKANYNPETKQYDGDCRLFILDRKISGGLNTHAY